jgi:hypothetical protein
MGKGRKVMCRTISFAKNKSLQNPITAKNMNALKKGVARIGMVSRLNFVAKNPGSQRSASKKSIINLVTKSDSKKAQISKVQSQTSLGRAINTNLPKRKSESYLIRPFSIAQELPRPRSQRKILPAPMGTFMTQICHQISVSKADSPNPPKFHQKKVSRSQSEVSISVQGQSQPDSPTSLDGKLDPKILCAKSQNFFGTKTCIPSEIAPSKRRGSNDSNLSTKQNLNIDQFFFPSTQQICSAPKSDFKIKKFPFSPYDQPNLEQIDEVTPQRRLEDRQRIFEKLAKDYRGSAQD